MKWLNQLLRRLTGAEADLLRIGNELSLARAARDNLATLGEESEQEIARLRAQLTEIQKDYDELFANESATEKRSIALRTELGELAKRCLAEKAARAQAEAKLALAQHYLTDLPAPTREDVKWEEDDAKALAAFLETAPAGKKLAQHLSNRLADYERAAVLYRSPADMPALLKRAHGFRDCRGEIVRLSAAGPLPANHEQPDFPLPADLENLRG